MPPAPAKQGSRSQTDDWELTSAPIPRFWDAMHSGGMGGTYGVCVVPGTTELRAAVAARVPGAHRCAQRARERA